MSIEFKENAVCYANGYQFKAPRGVYYTSICGDTSAVKEGYLIHQKDFQINEPKQGDYIEASELDTK